MSNEERWQEANQKFIEKICIYEHFKKMAEKHVTPELKQSGKDLEVVAKLNVNVPAKKIIMNWEDKDIAEINLEDTEIDLCNDLINKQNQKTALLNHSHESAIVRTLSESLLNRSKENEKKQFKIKFCVDLGSFN